MESSDEDEIAMTVCLAASSSIQVFTATVASRPRTGSRPGRAANLDLHVQRASELLDADFFCRLQAGTPAFSDKEFERLFRMPKSVYEKVMETVLEGDSFFIKTETLQTKKEVQQT